MKIKSILLCLSLFFISFGVFAQDNGSSSEAAEELTRELSEGIEKLADYLKSEDFQKTIDSALEAWKEMDLQFHDDGKISLHGETIDVESYMDDACNSLNDYMNDLEINGEDLKIFSDDFTKMMEDMIKKFEIYMEENKEHFNVQPQNNTKYKTL